MKLILGLLLALCVTPAYSQERTVNPTFLHRYVPQVQAQRVAISSPTAHYKPIFGEPGATSPVIKSVSRFGELTVDARGRSALVSYPREEHILVVLEGQGSISYGGREHPVRTEDFLYLPPGVEFGLSARGAQGVRAVLMGFKIPEGMPLVVPPTLQVANIADVPLQVVGNHPPSTLYRLLMGNTKSTRDRIAAGHVMNSLFLMEFTAGGTNFPHHHDDEEEIYLLLDGQGEMVAGSGVNGVEGRYPTRPGDAYYYRLNTTVGFYNSNAPSPKPARILAVRSSYPFQP